MFRADGVAIITARGVLIGGLLLAGLAAAAIGLVGGGSHGLAPVHPEDDPEVRPDTPVTFEAEADGDPWDVEWRHYEEGEQPGGWAVDPNPVYQSGWPHALYRTSFDSPGTYVVEARVTDEDGEETSRIEWTVTVGDEAPPPPTTEPVSPVDTTVYYDETGAFTVGVESGGDRPYRAAWWLAQCDVVEAFDSFPDASVFEYPINEVASGCEPDPFVMDANGMTTSGGPWNLTYAEALEVAIVDAETRGEVGVEVRNVGTEPHEADVRLEVEDGDGYRLADTDAATIDSGESREVVLAYDDDRDEFDVRVTAETGWMTRVSEAATVSDPSDPTPTATPSGAATATPTGNGSPTPADGPGGPTATPMSVEGEGTTPSATPDNDGSGAVLGSHRPPLGTPTATSGPVVGGVAIAVLAVAAILVRRRYSG